MRRILPFVCLSVLATAPLAAQPSAAREEVAVPAGKLHAKAFRPTAPQACAEARLNPSGNRIATTLPARDTAGCQSTAAKLAVAAR